MIDDIKHRRINLVVAMKVDRLTREGYDGQWFLKFCKENNYKFLTVKTLDESAIYEPYNGTRAFYRKEGFYPLEVFTCVWDEENPCLFMVKVISEVMTSDY